MRLLVVVDMQEDFIRGALTVPGAEEIISPIEKLVKEYIIADDAMGKTLKGFATEEISTKVSEETIPTKSNLFTLGKR